jgi:acyl-CoA thioester hydrolase
MPLVLERTFRVRLYECDAYGHVNHTNYLHYMQESALDASAMAGYATDRYNKMERQWLIRETDINYLRPLTYGDSVTVKTWVADFLRVRSRRMYELRHTESGEMVAQAHTDWVYLDMNTLRPVTIPQEMILAFSPEGAPAEPPQREPFPEPPAPPAGLFTMRRRVEWRDLDSARHVNNAVYMSYFEDCSVQDALSRGWPMERMVDVGFGIVARRYRIEYKQPALMQDELEVSTWISDIKRSSAIRHYTVSRDGTLLARAFAVWVWVDLKTGQPIHVPEDFIADFAANIV